MAVALKLDYLQSNDAKTIKFTDDTGAYDASTNTGGWGVPNQVTSDVVATTSTTASKYWLTLDIVYTDSSNVETTYDTIDLYTSFTSEFSKSYGMEYELDMSYLLSGTEAAGTSDDVFPDGIYNVTYKITEADTSTVVYTITYELLVEGVIRIKVYDYLKENTSTIYKQKQFNADERDWQDLMDSIYVFSYFNSMLAQGDDAQQSTILEMLYFLEQKLNN